MRRFLLLLLLFLSTCTFCIGQTLVTEKGDDGTTSKGNRDENGHRTGEWLKFYNNGKIFIRANYVNDTLEGKVISYYKNGRTQAENDYIAGKLNGTSKQFDIKGKPIREISYKDNLIFGNCKYYEDGLIDNERYYKKGVINGACKDYRKGKLYKEYTMLSTGEIKDQVCYNIKTGEKVNCNFF